MAFIALGQPFEGYNRCILQNVGHTLLFFLYRAIDAHGTYNRILAMTVDVQAYAE
jgi:hypothetical protein